MLSSWLETEEHILVQKIKGFPIKHIPYTHKSYPNNTSALNCIKQFWWLPELNRHILANQVWRYNWNNCFNCNVKHDWPELACLEVGYPINFLIQFSADLQEPDD